MDTAILTFIHWDVEGMVLFCMIVWLNVLPKCSEYYKVHKNREKSVLSLKVPESPTLNYPSLVTLHPCVALDNISKRCSSPGHVLEHKGLRKYRKIQEVFIQHTRNKLFRQL